MSEANRVRPTSRAERSDASTRRGAAAARLLLVLGLIGCGRGQKSPSAPHNPLADSADQVVFGARSKMTDGGVSKSDLYSDTAYFFDDNTRIEMRGHVMVTFFTDVGAKNAVLTSKEGTYNNRTGNMEARGNVIVNTVDGRHLTTSVLRFNQTRNEISSDSAFVTTDSSRRLTGIGFTSDPNMNNIHCLRACSGLGGQVVLPSNQPASNQPAPAGAQVATPAQGQALPTAPPPPPPPPAPPADSTRRDSTR
ncbi:MAG TPA: LPS export ABC transporter periplasmic protein LptC, partial [Gemmatimonadaceae bacterium]|nr:LPS export ABC transporter periplasmic protein LptC [Gemmatimonadaceae bacterium]